MQWLGFIHNLVSAIAIQQRDALLYLPADPIHLAGAQQVLRAFPANTVIQVPILRAAGAWDGGGQVQNNIAISRRGGQRFGSQDVAQHSLHPHPFERLNLIRSPGNRPDLVTALLQARQDISSQDSRGSQNNDLHTRITSIFQNN
jgi:hypothetical protein